MTTAERRETEAWVARLLARAVEPPERMSVAEWAARRRKISADSTSPYPGDWAHERTPHLVEVMEALSPQHPATDVYVRKSAQTGFTEAALNVVGHGIEARPTKMLYLLPTRDEAQKFNRLKLEPMISATPSLRRRVVTERESGKGGSTATFKRFGGGYLVVGNAGASSALQMISVQVLLCDEVTEYPDDVGGRGDPVDQAVARTKAFERKRPKRAFFSTPGVKGKCRIDAGVAKSDQRHYYVPCPHCGWLQRLEWERFRWRSDAPPHGAHMVCAAHGCVIEFKDLDAMVLHAPEGADGIGRLWIKCYEDADDPAGNPAPPPAFPPQEWARWRARPSKGRPPGFVFWQATSRLATWDGIAQAAIEATTPQKLRTFVQQVRGEAYEERGEAPDAEKLFLARPQRQRGSVPPGYHVLTGAVDVQGDRLEWAVYAWGPGMVSALVDWGVVEGPTERVETWARLDEARARSWPDAAGRRWIADLWCVDAGYRSAMAYRYCDTRGGATGRVVPIMGDQAASGPKAAVAPILSTPRKTTYDWEGRPIQGAALRYDLGTWPLKTLLHDGLRLALAGPDETGAPRPGSILFCRECDREFFEQIAAEAVLEATDKAGRVRRGWVKLRARNEQTDLWCYARAAAELLELQLLDAEGWAEIARARGPEQPELFGPAADLRREGASRGEPEKPAAPDEPWVNVGEDWLR